MIIDLGGSHKLNELDFKSPFDMHNERLALDFVLETLERNLAFLQDSTHYNKIVKDKPVNSVADVNYKSVC